MADEIERKYLLDMPSKEPWLYEQIWKGRQYTVKYIQQGYIGRVRLRTATKSGVKSHTICIKFGFGIVRKEYECNVPGWLVAILWFLTKGKRIVKTRYCIEDGLVWEIDIFRDRELVLAEVELPSADTLINMPMWLRPFLLREVTNESDYTNIKLAK